MSTQQMQARHLKPGDILHLPGLTVTVQVMRIRHGRAVVLCVGDSFPSRSWPRGYMLTVERRRAE